MDDLIDLQWLLWVGFALVLGAVEVASLDLVFAMIAASALVAAGVAFAGVSFPLQVITFAVATGVLLALVRPVLIRKIRPAIPLIRTGADAGVGQLAEVLEPVDVRTGRVKLRGEVWSARAVEQGAVLPVGADVEVVAIDGATALVRAVPTTGWPPGSPSSGPPSSGPSSSPWSPQ